MMNNQTGFLERAPRSDSPLIQQRKWLQEAYQIIDNSKKKFVDQQRRIQELEKISRTDELTGLLNREGFLEVLERELDRMKRNQASDGLLIFIEIDNLKTLTRDKSKEASENAVKIVAKILYDDSRKMDVLARIDCDQFAFLFTQTNAEKAVERIQFLIKKLNNLSFILHEEEISICTSLSVKNFKKTSKAHYVLPTNKDGEVDNLR